MGFTPIDESEIEPSTSGIAFTPIDDADIGVPETTPSRVDDSMWNEIYSAGNRLTEGVGSLVDFAEATNRNLNPFYPTGPRLFGLNENPLNQGLPEGDTIGAKLVQGAKNIGFAGEEKANTAAGKVLGEVAYYAPNAIIPGGALPSLTGGLTAGGIKAAGGDELQQAIGGVVGGIAPSLAVGAVKSGYSAIRDLISPTAKADAAKVAAKEILSKVSNTDDALLALEKAKVADAMVPAAVRSTETYLPQYARTAERTGQPGIAALEETLRRTDEGLKQAATLQDALRSSARTGIYDSINPAPMLDSEAGTIIRSGLEANKGTIAKSVEEFASKAFQRADELPIGSIKDKVTNTLKSFTDDGSREITPGLRRLVDNFNKLPENTDLKTIQNYRSALGEYANPGPMASTEEKISARIAASMRSALDDSVEGAVAGGVLPEEQAAAWKSMRSARAEKGALFESGEVGNVLKKEPFNTGYKVAAEDVTRKVLSTKEDAQQLVKALSGQTKSIEAARSSLLSNIWDKSTNAMTGEINPTSFHKQLKLVNEVAPKVLTSQQTQALTQIADDLASQSKVKATAFAASRGQSATSEATSAINLLQQAVQETSRGAARRALQRVPVVGQLLDDTISIVADPKKRQMLVNQELAKFVMDPDHAIALLKTPSKQTTPILEKLARNIAATAAISAPAAREADKKKKKLKEEAQQSEYSSLFNNTSMKSSREDNIQSLFGGGNMDAKPLVELTEEEIDADPLFRAVVWQESRGNPNAKSPKGAIGLAQIMPATGKDIARRLKVTKYDLWDPLTNKRFGKSHLDRMRELFKDDALALAAYNAGEGRVGEWVEKWGPDWTVISNELEKRGAYKETRDYVPSILKRRGDIVEA